MQNLRSALDHLACHLVAIGPGPKKTNVPYFPIAETATEYASSSVRRKIQGARPEAIRYLDAYEPYKGGKFLLWELHELNKIDKHRLLLTACSTQVAHSITPSRRAELEEIFRGSHPAAQTINLRSVLIPFDNSTPLKVGNKLLSVPHSEMEKEMNFLLDIAFNEPQIVKCYPIVELLLKMTETVSGVIHGCRIGGFL